MRCFGVLRASFCALFHKDQLESEVEEELRFHLAMRTAENIRRGMSEAEARAEARRQFGNVNLIKDRWRDVIGGGLLETLWQDVRFAVRVLRADRTFSVVAVVVLAFTICVNTAVFTLIDGVALRPLPFVAPERIMAIWSGATLRPEAKYTLSHPDFRDLQSENRTFDSVAAFYSTGIVIAGGGGKPEQVQGTFVTA